ncbi:MAG TPA: TonB family protein, partial [Vicinamibacteria bacterium]
LGGDVSPPRRISGAWPSAPAGEPRAGVAIVDAYVRDTGEVERVAEVSGDKRLSGALLEVVLGWRFRPAERKGAPVAARLRIQHVFLP